jgi:hypothetical protein
MHWDAGGRGNGMVLPILEARAALPFSPENFWPPYSFLYLYTLEIWHCIDRGIWYHQALLSIHGQAALWTVEFFACTKPCCTSQYGAWNYFMLCFMLCINRMKLYLLHVDHCPRNEEVEREEQVEVNTWQLLSGIFRCGTFLSARDQEKLSTSIIPIPLYT